MYTREIIKECNACNKQVSEILEKAVKRLKEINIDVFIPPHRFSVDKPFIKKRIVDVIEYVEEAIGVLK